MKTSVRPSWSPPSMGALRAFVAAARANSFTRAAEELGVTQSAVSHGVAELERRLGWPLFTREGRRIALSDSGQRYLPYAVEALERVRAGEAVLRDRRAEARVLTVSVSPSFAAKWLVPRVGDFVGEHPDLDLRISANPQHVDLDSGEVDIAVRHGDGNWPDLHTTQLCVETMFPVCNPMIFDSGPLEPAALGNYPLIHHRSHEPWLHWFRAFGLDPPPEATHGPVYNEMSLAIDAAVAGQGIALARTALAALDLMGGRLAKASNFDVPASFSYWIVCSRTVAHERKIRRFRDWLLRQAENVTTGG